MDVGLRMIGIIGLLLEMDVELLWESEEGRGRDEEILSFAADAFLLR